MARNELDNDELNRLCEAMYHARKDLERFRTERKEAVKQYVGGHWNEEGSPQKVPLNLISLYVQIVGRSLIPKAPNVMLSTFNRSQKPAVNAMEQWANLEMKRMGIAGTLQRIILDALFSIGIGKVSLLDPAHSSLWGWDTPAGTAFVERVDLDDFVFDTHARDFREASFLGHRYRVPLAAVRDNPMYSGARKNLTASDDEPFNSDGDERINTMQRGAYRTSMEFEEMVDLWEIYLPRHKLVVTLPDDAVDGVMSDGGTKFEQQALRQVQWVGHESGPYKFLSFGCVPGNAMPKSPVQDLIDLHMVTNDLYIKLMRQGERQKELLTVQGQADTDGERIMNADDGEIIRLDNPDKTKVATFGGPNQGNLQLAIHLCDKFSYMAGNLDAMGGLSPQAKTLGQDRMLMESASRTVQDMQETAISFVSEVCESLCWLWWNDPFKVMRVEHQIPGVPESKIVRKVYPRGARAQTGQPMPLRRDGSWDDLNLSVDPYSLQHSTPSQRLQALMQVVREVILPMQPMLQQQGIGFDISKLLEIMSKYTNLPELNDIVTIQEPPAAGPGAGGDGGGPTGGGDPKEYIRRSLGGNTASTRQAVAGNMTSPDASGSGGGVQ